MALRRADDLDIFNSMIPNVSGELIPDTVAMTTDAIFDLASVSKCLGTTLAFMRLVEDGLVRLDDNVSRYIPGFEPWVEDLSPREQRRQKRSPERVPITVKQLLTHTSGLPAAIHVPSFLARYDIYGDSVKINYRDSLVTYLAHDAARLSRPSEVFRYSCLNFITLQAILENVTGERLDRYAAREIYEPLHLKNTWYNALDDAKRPYAADAPIVPTEVQEDGTLLRGEVQAVALPHRVQHAGLGVAPLALQDDHGRLVGAVVAHDGADPLARMNDVLSDFKHATLRSHRLTTSRIAPLRADLA